MDSAGKRAEFQMVSGPHHYPASASAEGAATHAFENFRPPPGECQDSGVSQGFLSVPTNSGSATPVSESGCYGQQIGIAHVTACDRGAGELNANVEDNDDSQGTRSSWFAYRPIYSPAEEGFTKVVATVGSWVAAAFEAYEVEEEDGNGAEGDLDNRERGVLPGNVSADAELNGGELTSEEAATKEATVRSLGNRIWAFFGGGGATQDASAGGEVPTSADAVEETIPFEDPAVVQRDDHRTYPNETRHLFESIKLQPLLQVLNPQQQKYLASLMRREVVAPSVCVVEEGGESVLVWCSSGEFDVTQAGFFGTSVVRTLTSGEFFGVEELLAGEKMKCSVTAQASASDCVVWTLDKEMFQDSMRDMLAKRVAFVPVAQSFFHTVRLIRDLPEEQISALAKACKVERFAEGQTVFKMGFHGDMLCFIYKGEAITQKPQDDGGFLELARQGRGEYFGEMALIRNARRTASVVAGTELILLCLDKESFERLLAPLKEKMAAKAASSYKRQDDAPPTETESKLAAGPSPAPIPGSREAAEALVQKRTRKSSLALLNYSKIRDQEKQAEDGEDQVPKAKPTARWHLAQEPESIHEPPPLTATGSRSCLKLDKQPSRGRVRKSPVRFDEESLLPSETSSDEG